MTALRRAAAWLLDWAADRLDRLSPPSGQHAPMTPAATPAAGGAPAPTGAREVPAPAVPPGGAGASPGLRPAAPEEGPPPPASGAVPRRWVIGPAASVTGPGRGFVPVTAVTVTAPGRAIPDGTGRGEHPYPDHLAATVASLAVPDDVPEDWPPGPLVRLYADPHWLLGDTRRIRARDLAARVSTADGYGSAIWRARTRTGAAA